MNIELTTVGERGQAVIPKIIREEMPAPKGTLFSVVLVDKDTVVFRRVDKKKLVGEFRALRATMEKLSETELVGEIKKTREHHN